MCASAKVSSECIVLIKNDVRYGGIKLSRQPQRQPLNVAICNYSSIGAAFDNRSRHDALGSGGFCSDGSLAGLAEKEIRFFSVHNGRASWLCEFALVGERARSHRREAEGNLSGNTGAGPAQVPSLGDGRCRVGQKRDNR